MNCWITWTERSFSYSMNCWITCIDWCVFLRLMELHYKMLILTELTQHISTKVKRGEWKTVSFFFFKFDVMISCRVHQANTGNKIICHIHLRLIYWLLFVNRKWSSYIGRLWRRSVVKSWFPICKGSPQTNNNGSSSSRCPLQQGNPHAFNCPWYQRLCTPQPADNCCNKRLV